MTENSIRPVGSSPPRRRIDALAPWLIAFGSLIILVSTLSDYGMAWDEGFTVEREERLGEWFSKVLGRDGPGSRAWSPETSNLERRVDYLRVAGIRAGSPWSRESLRFYWQFAREEPNGHPPFYALLGLAGWSVARYALPDLEAYRFGPAALFAATLGVIYAFMSRRHGRGAGLVASVGLLTMPRVFAHAHLASYDVPTLCLWFLAVATFLRSTEGGPRAWRWAIGFGLAWGLASGTKLTGWFVPIPLAFWTLLYRDRRGLRTLAIGLPIAAVVVLALNPPWWSNPVEGVATFLRSNLGREQRSPIPTLFFGRIYMYALPWYNTLAWSAIVTPPVTLILGLMGASGVALGRFRDKSGTMLLVCWAFFLVLRALPGAPGHDGDRQFLAGFAFLAGLAGLGARMLISGVGRLASPGVVRVIGPSAVALTLALGGWETWRCHPLQLSYYNILIGGLSGASKAGMEPTYYWDALTPGALAWINDRTAPGRSVMFAYPIPTFEYLHRWGRLRPSPLPDSAHLPQWYVVQNRLGMLRTYGRYALDARLLERFRPVFTVTMPEAPGVPLVSVFAIEDAAEAERAITPRVRLGESPEHPPALSGAGASDRTRASSVRTAARSAPLGRSNR